MLIPNDCNASFILHCEPPAISLLPNHLIPGTVALLSKGTLKLKTLVCQPISNGSATLIKQSECVFLCYNHSDVQLTEQRTVLHGQLTNQKVTCVNLEVWFEYALYVSQSIVTDHLYLWCYC